MRQIAILWIPAIESHEQALKVLQLVREKVLPSTTIEDTMYAYMIARYWKEWITSESLYDNDEYRGAFELYMDDFSKQLQEQKDELKKVFNSTLFIKLITSNDEVFMQNTCLYFLALRRTAQMFEDLGDNSFSQILHIKNVPPIEKLIGVPSVDKANQLLQTVKAQLPPEFEVQILESRFRHKRSYLLVVKYPDNFLGSNYNIRGFGHTMHTYQKKIQSILSSSNYGTVRTMYHCKGKIIIYSPNPDGEINYPYLYKEVFDGGAFYTGEDVNTSSIINYLIKTIRLGF